MAWPKGRPRKPLQDGESVVGEPVIKAPKRSWAMKAKPNWETMVHDDGSMDRFRIAKEMIPEGMDLQWVTDTVMGQPVIQHRSDFEKKGWTPVHQEDFDGRFDGMFMSKGQEGEINNGGQVLMARPIELSIKARQRELKEAKEKISIREAALRGGDIPGVNFDTQHQSIHNKVARSWERLEVPKE
jgi:hypothetical protein